MGIFKSLFQDNQELEEPEFMPDPTEVPKELLDAEDRCPNVKFVKSCRAFFDKKGFLSAAQRNALTYSGTPNRRYNQGNGYSPDYFEDRLEQADFGDNPFDPDRE